MAHGFLKCECEHCNGHIEYPVESAGEVARCPHCQLPTPLTIPGTESEGGIEVGGSKAKFVIAALVALVLVAAGVSVFVFVLAAKKKKDSVPSPQSAPQGSVPAPAAGATAVPGGDWQQVRPYVGKFQGGYTGAQVAAGRDVMAGPCQDCHKIYDPIRFKRSEWDNVLGNMRGRAKLRGNEYDAIKRFVASIRD